MFQSQGIPCRHILCVLKGKGLNEIPSNYTVQRWTKLATSKPIFDVDGNVMEGSSELTSESQLIADAWNHLFTCMHKVVQCKENFLLVINGVVNIEKQLTEFKENSIQSKEKEVEPFIGCNLPIDVEIHPPQLSKTKGSGKRIKGGKEKAIEQQQKRTRLCRTCGQHAYHDSRNCPKKSSP
ncbi:Zinc finger, PMZ-type [Sesbania bispinosa]|nr:Zinc finger, PMZ-type [Sesbania bispinosa]